MTTSQQKIRDFMHLAGQAVPDSPTCANSKVRELRVKLLAEELLELASALGVKLQVLDGVITVDDDSPEDICLTEVYDALVDLQYVNEGAAVAFGLDMEPGFEEVHSSNMSKFIDGYRRDDGKWIKGPSYRPANLGPIIETQRLNALKLKLPNPVVKSGI